jgi:hypothetical protein
LVIALLRDTVGSKAVPMQSDRQFERLFPSRHIAGAVFLVIFAAIAGGCSTDQTPTKIMVTPIASTMSPARPPDCDMPVLSQQPTTTYQQIAIIEAWANVEEDPAKVLPDMKRQACAAGAQALLIVDNRKQDIKSLLYGPTPNEKENEITSENRDPNQAADYIKTMQHHPRVGEAGHTGYYIDAVAITYSSGSNTTAKEQPSTP